MTAPVLERIVTYPVKGLSGLDRSVAVIDGRGLPDDRRWAITTGALPLNPKGAWTPCQAFQRLTILPTLTEVEVTEERGSLTLRRAGMDTIIMPGATKPDGDQVKAMFGPTARLVKAAAGRFETGYWDHADAELSIINLNTVEVIARAVGRPVDPGRFRGNLYVRAPAWSEFGWLGRSFSLGDAQLAVMRPIDRCRATSVDSATGKSDINIPAELMRRFGHMFCGVYATVLKGGKIEPGDRLAPLVDAAPVDLRPAIGQPTAPDLASWPRVARVREVLHEADDIRSVWLDDPLVASGSLNSFRAGQHLRIDAFGGKGGVWRAYSISGRDRGGVRITVKRGKGAGSRAIHNLQAGDELLMSGPFGTAVLGHDSHPVLLASAGIGVTPHVAMLRELAALRDSRRVDVIHVARSECDLALWGDIVACVDALPDARATLCLTKGKPDLRPAADEIASHAEQSNAVLYVCGPAGFMQAVCAAARHAGITDDRIVTETFATPDVDTSFRDPPLPGPFAVRFRRSGIDATWTAADGTLLDLAEQHGLTPAAHCRAGICGTCRQKVTVGRTALLGSPAHVDSDGTTLLCCSVPEEDIIIEL